MSQAKVHSSHKTSGSSTDEFVRAFAAFFADSSEHFPDYAASITYFLQPMMIELKSSPILGSGKWMLFHKTDETISIGDIFQ